MDGISTQSLSSSNIVYEYSLYASDLPYPKNLLSTPSSDMPLGDLELTLSELPRVVGETAEITINFTIDVDFPEWEQHKEFITDNMAQSLSIRGVLEFVDDSEVTESSPNRHDDGMHYRISKDMPLISHGDTITWTAQVQAVEEGVAEIRYYIGGGHSESKYFKIHIGEEESLLYDDYIAIYGESILPPPSPVDFITGAERLEMLHIQIMEGTFDGEDEGIIHAEAIPLDQTPEEEM